MLVFQISWFSPQIPIFSLFLHRFQCSDFSSADSNVQRAKQLSSIETLLPFSLEVRSRFDSKKIHVFVLRDLNLHPSQGPCPPPRRQNMQVLKRVQERLVAGCHLFIIFCCHIFVIFLSSPAYFKSSFTFTVILNNLAVEVKLGAGSAAALSSLYRARCSSSWRWRQRWRGRWRWRWRWLFIRRIVIIISRILLGRPWLPL